MSEQPTHAMLVRADDGLHLLPACNSRECAERTVTFVTGADVLGIVELYPEPIPGVQFWSAVQLGQAPKTAAESASPWRPITEAPKDGSQSRILLAWADGTVEQGMYVKNETWQGFRPESLRPWPKGQPIRFMPLPAPPQDDQP